MFWYRGTAAKGITMERSCTTPTTSGSPYSLFVKWEINETFFMQKGSIMGACMQKKQDLTNSIPSGILTLMLFWAGTVGLYPTGGLVVHGGGLDEVPGEKNFLESWQKVDCLLIFFRIISRWNNLWLQVRNARGKIVEGAQEKRDQLIQTFKVIFVSTTIFKVLFFSFF